MLDINWKGSGLWDTFSCMNMYINVPFYFQILLPDGSPRYNILINGYGYTNAFKIGGNENNA